MLMFRLLCICREELERWKALYQRENFQQSTVNGHWICGTEVLFVPCSEEDTKYIKWHSDKTRVNLETLLLKSPLVKVWSLEPYQDMHFISNIYIRGLRGDPYMRDDVCGLLLLDFVVECWSSDTVLYINLIWPPLFSARGCYSNYGCWKRKITRLIFSFFRTSIWSYYFVITPIDQNKWRLEILIITSK